MNLLFLVFILSAISENQISASLISKNMVEYFDKPWRSQRHGTQLTKLDKEYLERLNKKAAMTSLRPKQANQKPRKEYHCLDPTERQRLHQSLRNMKATMAGDNSEYDTFVLHHDGARSPSAHQGPSFVIWHRMFLFIMEKALQKYNPNVTMVYLDNRLIKRAGVDPKYSVLFGPDMVGPSDGVVDVGPFANWTVGSENCKKVSPVLARNVSDMSYLYDDSIINDLLAFKTYKDICTPWNPSFENLHGQIHLFIGGLMGEVMCAPYDPLFYFHHAFVDYLYEKCVRKPIVDLKNELAYPDISGALPLDKYYSSTHRMLPFGIRHAEMLNSAKFVPQYYRSPGDVVCRADADCCPNGLSTFVWCDVTANRCVAKVVEGSPVTRNFTRACYCKDKKPAILKDLCSCI